MVLLQRIREQAAGSAVADLFAADYVGALLGGLAFPFLLMPVFGQLKGALVVGAVNAVAGLALVCTVFRRELSRRARLVARRRLRRGRALPGVRLGDRRRLRGDRPAAALPGPGGARRAQPLPGDRADPVGAPRSATPTPTCGCSSTATSSSARSTSTATTRRWCTRRCAARAATCWSSAAATASPCGRSCATRTSPGDRGRPRPGGGGAGPHRAAAARRSTAARSTTPGYGCSTPTRSAGCVPPPSASTWWSPTCPTRTRRPPPSSTRSSSTRCPLGARRAGPAGRAVRLAVLRAPVVLVDRGVDAGGRLRHRAVPRRRAVLRRLGFPARRAGDRPAGAGTAGRRAPAAFPRPGVLRAAAAFPADRAPPERAAPAPCCSRGCSTTPARSGAATDPHHLAPERGGCVRRVSAHGANLLINGVEWGRTGKGWRHVWDAQGLGARIGRRRRRVGGG